MASNRAAAWGCEARAAASSGGTTTVRSPASRSTTTATMSPTEARPGLHRLRDADAEGSVANRHCGAVVGDPVERDQHREACPGAEDLRGIGREADERPTAPARFDGGLEGHALLGGHWPNATSGASSLRGADLFFPRADPDVVGGVARHEGEQAVTLLIDGGLGRPGIPP